MHVTTGGYRLTTTTSARGRNSGSVSIPGTTWTGSHRVGRRVGKSFFLRIRSIKRTTVQREYLYDSSAPVGTHKFRYITRVQRLIKMAPHFIRTQFMSRPDGIPDWVDATGRIVLLGDAAHPPYVSWLGLYHRSLNVNMDISSQADPTQEAWP